MWPAFVCMAEESVVHDWGVPLLDVQIATCPDHFRSDWLPEYPDDEGLPRSETRTLSEPPA